MSVDVNQLFDMLASDDEDIQRQGLEEAAKVKYLSIFILPSEGKRLWENCAKVLARKADEELDPYLMQIFEWLQDANWPGFDEIYNRLRKIPAIKIVSDFSFIISYAKTRHEINREMWLTYLSGLIRNQELLELLPSDQQELMKEYYKKWWVFQEE
jgi:hypothetical protein